MSIQTSVLVLQRKPEELIAVETAAGRINDYPVFMAVANHVGHDKRGNRTYVRDAKGNEVIEEVEEQVKEWEDGTPIYRKQTTRKKVSTTTPSRSLRSSADGSPSKTSCPAPAPKEVWPWHTVKCGSFSASAMFGGDRRMEAETYLSTGYGIRKAIEGKPGGWTGFGHLARAWMPGRLKGIQVSRDYGTPFVAATQVFDVRPVPRKWLASTAPVTPQVGSSLRARSSSLAQARSVGQRSRTRRTKTR